MFRLIVSYFRKMSVDTRASLSWQRSDSVVAVKRWGPVVAWMAVIFFMSSLTERPGTPGLANTSWDDKLQHTVAYAILAVLLWRAQSASRDVWFRSAVAILVASFYGAFDEFHQLFVPGRECSLSDWHCDSAGAAMASMVLGILNVRIADFGTQGGEKTWQESRKKKRLTR
ncbi:MAG: VanZ family protein [Armatimonadota bacterium]